MNPLFLILAAAMLTNNSTPYQDGFYVGVQTGLEMGKWWGASMAGNADAYNGLAIVCDQYNKILAAVLGAESNRTKELIRSKPEQAEMATPEAGGQIGSTTFDMGYVLSTGNGRGRMGGCV